MRTLNSDQTFLCAEVRKLKLHLPIKMCIRICGSIGLGNYMRMSPSRLSFSAFTRSALILMKKNTGRCQKAKPTLETNWILTLEKDGRRLNQEARKKPIALAGPKLSIAECETLGGQNVSHSQIEMKSEKQLQVRGCEDRRVQTRMTNSLRLDSEIYSGRQKRDDA